MVRRLAEAGKFDEEPILRDLREQRLAAVIAADDVRPDVVGHTNWTVAMRHTIARYYWPEVTCPSADGLRSRVSNDVPFNESDT